MKPWLRWTLGIGTGLVLLVVALWQSENRRGQRMWEETCARLRAAGEPVELADIIPPMIPDEENVAAAPIFAEVFRDEKGAQLARFANAFEGRVPRRSTEGGSEAVFPPSPRPLFADDMSHVQEWRDYLRAWLPDALPSTPMTAADEILYYLKQWDGEVQALREALRRPKCRWPLRYEDGVMMRMPMLMICLNVIKIDRPRILAQAAKGDASACTETLLADLRLARATNANAPLLIGLLVEITGDALALKSLQHILPAIQFNAEQLAALQQQLDLISLDAVSKALQYERVAGTRRMLHHNFEELQRDYDPGKILPFDRVPAQAEETAASILLLSMAYRPEGWKLIDAASFANFIHDEVRPCVDEAAGTVLRTRVTAMEAARLAQKGAAGRLSLMRNLPEYFDNLLIKAARHQALVREAGLWCAVERFRHKFGRIPDRLEELVPEFTHELPVDPVNGLPLHYIRKGAGDYLIYSIGWNEKDEGGMEARRDEEGDWVWASDPRLIVNLDEEKRKAEEAKAAEWEAKRKTKGGKSKLSSKSKMPAAKAESGK